MQHLTEAFYESRTLAPVGKNQKSGDGLINKALGIPGLGGRPLGHNPYGMESKRTLVGTSERKVQGFVDLSLVGPGEFTKAKKRTRDGRFKVSSSSSERYTERSESLTSSDRQTPGQLAFEADQDSEGTEAVMYPAAPVVRRPTTSTKASARAKPLDDSFRKKPSLKYAQAIRHQTSKHLSQSSSSADEHVPRRRTPIASPKSYSTSESTSSLLRLREMGHRGKSGWLNVNGSSYQLRSRKFDDMKPWRSWTGASNDVMVLAWSPDGQSYAAGASAQTDDSSMQYNRPNNLLYGSLPKNTIWELPDHRLDRPLPATGPNSNQATYDACDPDLYMSVTSVRFSASGNRMYSASYDETVKVWDTSTEGRLLCTDTLLHDAQLEVMALSGHGDEHLATGSRLVNDAIRVYKLSEDGSVLNHLTLSSLKAQSSPALEIYPSCLQWGVSSSSQHLLLAGFSESMDRDDSHDPGKAGDLCLWDLIKGKPMEVIPRSQNVFDVTWHPTLPVFAVGTVLRVGHISDKSCRSAVRIYEPFRMAGRSVEFECPALDINDVSFCPTDSYCITAGCTNGTTYVWDYRKPQAVLHQLRHGLPIAPMKPDMTREQSDTGIRLTAWSDSGSKFCTGSSDGVIKSWNVKLAPEDVHVRDIAHFEAGVMCGAFSPDFTNLLVGDARGSVHILSTAPIIPFDSDLDVVRPIRYQHARDTHRVIEDCDAGTPLNENLSAEAARALISSDEITMHPLWGAGQGPNYKGPYASYAREKGADPRTEPLLPQFQAQQLDSGQRAQAARAGFRAEPAELKIIAVQHDLARARNMKVVKEDQSQTKYPIRLSPVKQFQRTPTTHNLGTQKQQKDKQPISQRSTPSGMNHYLHSKMSPQKSASHSSRVSEVSRKMQMSEKYNVT